MKHNSWHPRFIRILNDTGNISEAARGAGISRTAAYAARDRHQDFREAWDDAQEAGIAELEAEARRRAMSSSDTLLIFLLKAHRPHVYRESIRVEQVSALADQLAARHGVSANELLAEAARIAGMPLPALPEVVDGSAGRTGRLVGHGLERRPL